MVRKYIKYMVVILTFVVGITNAQDVRYSQPFTSPLTLNPALMNINDDLNVTLNHRSQWGTIADAYTTSSLTVLYPIFLNGRDSKFDVGANVIMDKAGAFSNLNFSLALGYGLKMSESNYLSLAFSGGYIQQTLDASGLTFDDQYVLGSYSSSNATGQTIANEKIGYADVNVGLLWNYRPDDSKLNAYAGISGFHLTEPKGTFTDLNGNLSRRFSSQIGMKIIGENKLDFTPNIIVTSQAGSEEVAAGLYMDYRISEDAKLTLGGWYRKDDAIAFIIKVGFKGFVVGYSYDLPNSELGRTIGGLNVHEISLSYRLNRNPDKESTSLL